MTGDSDDRRWSLAHRFTPDGNRRAFLRTVAATGLATTMAGCNQNTETPTRTSTQPTSRDQTFAANPAGLDTSAGALGYQLLDHRERTSSTPLGSGATDTGTTPKTSAGGPMVHVTSQIASYKRDNAVVTPAGLAVLATPSAEVNGTGYNQLTTASIQDILAGRAGPVHPWPHASADAASMTGSLPILFGGSPSGSGWLRGPTVVDRRQASLLDQSTTLESVAGVTDRDVFVLTNAARVTVDGDAILVVAVHALDGSGSSNTPLIGSDGFVTGADVDATASVTADAMAEVIRGRVPELSTGQPSGPLRIVDETLTTTGSGVTERAELRVRAENIGSDPLEFAEVVPEFYDSAGEIVAIEHGEQFFVDPGEIFVKRVPVGGDPSAVSSRNVETNAKPATDAETVDDITLVSDSLVTNDVEARVEGTVRNDGDAVDYLGVRAKFYAESDLVWAGDAHLTEVAAGESREFTIDYEAEGHEPFSSVTDHTVELVGQWWWQQY